MTRSRSDRPVIDEALNVLRRQKSLAERAVEQLADTSLHEALHPETNSIAVIMKHMAGNMRSRWTDFLTTDGEKPWRDRDDEFIDDRLSRDDQLQRWEAGWKCVFDALDALSDDDLNRTIHIRGEPQTVLRAILRQIDHYAYHVGQIVLIARTLAGDDWQSLSIPRGQSKQYNERVWKK